MPALQESNAQKRKPEEVMEKPPLRSSTASIPISPYETSSSKAVTSSKSSSGPQQNAVVFSPELLRIYYDRLFPYEAMYDWLSYGVEKDFFNRREWSFTIQPTPEDEIYIRYQSFKDLEEFKSAVIKRQPNKIDIGAVFTHQPKDHNNLSKDVFHTEERELVFDIDLTDYDGVRTCCSGANICNKCWKYMNMAVKVMDEGLKTDFGFNNLVWFYSGRRGVHCWVCDESARTLSNDARSAVATYFELPLENEEKSLDLNTSLHPMLARSFGVLEPMFLDHLVGEEGMGLLSNQEQWVKLLKTLPEEARKAGIAAELDKEWTKRDVSPADKWKMLKSRIEKETKKEGAKKQRKFKGDESERLEMWPIETVFRHTYPRLDINVSKMQNHLLKSPFCVHPKTGRVCIPIDVSKIDSFDPFNVPTLPQIVSELESYAKENGESKNVPDWQKTSLKGSMQFFLKTFLNPMKNEQRKRRMEEKAKEEAFTGDF
ncbi:hypothetical protein TrST_g13242 [Triparma strigata]|uniref:DNA primase n=1 Tax=Triparma strigata TaxID=1606541 RepID=A0A9W7AQZ6_9STRA|nr:hypothetical protein TrST_g13242 [Triparma strigata]